MAFSKPIRLKSSHDFLHVDLSCGFWVLKCYAYRLTPQKTCQVACGSGAKGSSIVNEYHLSSPHPVLVQVLTTPEMHLPQPLGVYIDTHIYIHTYMYTCTIISEIFMLLIFTRFNFRCNLLFTVSRVR